MDPSDQRADAGLGELLERAARAQEETRRLLVKLQQSQAQLAAIQAEMAFRSRCGGEWPSPMPPLERGGSTSDEQ